MQNPYKTRMKTIMLITNIADNEIFTMHIDGISFGIHGLEINGRVKSYRRSEERRDEYLYSQYAAPMAFNRKMIGIKNARFL